MKVKNLTLLDNAYPSRIKNLTDAPRDLYYLGADPTGWQGRPSVSIVGSRAVTTYGKQVTARLSSELAEQGIVIVSGLALGVDGIAHTACLEAGGTTVAVLAGGLDKISPPSHTQLARCILEQSGTLISEYAPGTPGYKDHFIARNRIVAALGDVLLITEATERSGTMHTARFALEQGRDVLVVPGNITSPSSAGTNNLIKSGATPVTSVDDVLYALGAKFQPVATPKRPKGSTAEEQAILDMLLAGTTDGHKLLTRSKLPTSLFSQVLTMLEIGGKIRPLGNNHWSLK
jgi:DNA processing protein